MSISQVSELIRKKDLSPTELLEAHLRRIENVNGKLNAFITVMAEQAQKSARFIEDQIQKGNHIGPLQGVPIALKDLFNTKGVRTASGSVVMRDFIPTTDSAVTERLRQAGAIIIGKLQMDEFAMGATSVNPHDGPARNPWNLDCITGGSSGGSAAAVAGRLCMGSMGSDTGGSIRVPATFCGIVGFKPTFGLVSRYGVLPVSWTLDTVGPMTRTVRDAAFMLNAIAGHDSRDSSTSTLPVKDFSVDLDKEIKGIRIGILEEALSATIEPEIGEIFKKAVIILKDLGACVEDVSISLLKPTKFSNIIMLTEYATVHEEVYKSQGDKISSQARNAIEDGLLIRGIDYVKANQEFISFKEDCASMWDSFDILIGPTERITAPTIKDASENKDGKTQIPTLSSLVKFFNITGAPSLTVPCGFTSKGMPVGMQIAASEFNDPLVLRVAQAYENATKWHMLQPSIL